MKKFKLSIIIPVYNEAKTIRQIIKKITRLRISGVTKEIIIVDDGSTDNSEFMIQNSEHKKLKFLRHKRNLGKGAAIKTGLAKARGEYIIIQDADLEYEPCDIIRLIKPIQNGQSQVVYGTRLKRLPNFKKDERTLRFFLHYLGNKGLSLLTSFLYGQWITDMETGYKLFPRKAVKDLSLKAKGFEVEAEITAKLLKQRYKIIEVSITTKPRDYTEGKKLRTILDGSRAFYTLIKYRFFD